MEKIVTRLYSDAATAQEAVARICDAGYAREEVSLMLDPARCEWVFDEPGDHPGNGALTGAIVGGLAGTAGGAVILGPLGALVGGATGLVAGALDGFLLSLGMPSDEAQRCEHAIGEGGVVVAVHVHPNDELRVRGLLEPTQLARDVFFAQAPSPSK